MCQREILAAIFKLCHNIEIKCSMNKSMIYRKQKIRLGFVQSLESFIYVNKPSSRNPLLDVMKK